MADIRAPQSNVYVIHRASSGDINLPQSNALAVYNVPTDNLAATESLINVVNSRAATIRTTHATVLALVRGRVFDPTLRAWTYTLDGHDFYVIQLGMNETLIYDTFAGEWAVYGSNNSRLWKVATGCNWLGGDALAAVNGSNVVVGDDSTGALYFLDPDYDWDDHSATGVEGRRQFKREVQAQMVLKGHNAVGCYAFELEGSIGSNSVDSSTTVNLSYSDDRGNTYDDAGDIETPTEVYDTRLDWQSLGSMDSPGRLFKITDYGALKRIDGIMVTTDLEG